MTVRVLVFDFDGCLNNNDYINSSKNLIESNQALLDSLKAENNHYSTTIGFVGSNRQSRYTDYINSFISGSCFPAYLKVAKYLGAEFDPFLLADVYGDLEHGTSFHCALEHLNDNHANWLFDETKATILYAQMHKVASEHPNEDIVFEFYDDRMDILNALKTFYSKYPNLIPKNVTLSANHYTGDALSKTFEIIGTGLIDSNYCQTVKDMAAQDPADGSAKAKHTAYTVNPDNLTNRKEADSSSSVQPKRIKPEDMPEGIKNAYDADKMQVFVDLIAQLKFKWKYFVRGNHKNAQAADAVYGLQTSLIKNKIAFVNGTIDYETFSNNCERVIKAAHVVLDKHRGWKDVLCNLLLAISVIGHLIKGVVNAVNHRPFLFFTSTKSSVLLDQVQASCNDIGISEPALARG